jgi:hypothetical protein
MNIEFAKESLLYIAMLFVTAGGAALSAKEYLIGIVLLILGGGVVVLRAILKKKGYDIKDE